MAVVKTHSLVTDIQEGFIDDTVSVKINGHEVFRKEHTTTSLLVGTAASFTTYLKEGPVEVSAGIPTRNLARSTRFTVASDTYLGISIVEPEIYGDNVRFIVSREPFGYL